MKFQKIIIPSSLHPDTIVGIFLLKKFGQTKYPGIEHAGVEFMQELPLGESTLSLKDKGILVIDVGGGELDHHTKNEKILSELIVEDLGISEDSALLKLLEYAKRDDKYGMGTVSTDQIDRTFGLSGLISSLNKTVNDSEKILQIIFPVLEAHYVEEKKRTVELPMEFNEMVKNGKAEIFEVKQGQKKLKVVALESDNVSMPGWLKSSTGLKADVVCQRKNSGYTNILTKQVKKIDLRWVAAYLRDEEIKLQRPGMQIPISRLMSPGKIAEAHHWYYDRATNSILNGGTNPKGLPATAITLVRIKEILKDSLSREFYITR